MPPEEETLVAAVQLYPEVEISEAVVQLPRSRNHVMIQLPLRWKLQKKWFSCSRGVETSVALVLQEIKILVALTYSAISEVETSVP